MVSRGSGNPVDQPLYDRLWGAGFLPSRYQGVKFRSGGDPVLYLSNPAGVDAPTRRRMLDDVGLERDDADPHVGGLVLGMLAPQPARDLVHLTLRLLERHP